VFIIRKKGGGRIQEGFYERIEKARTGRKTEPRQKGGGGRSVSSVLFGKRRNEVQGGSAEGTRRQNFGH